MPFPLLFNSVRYNSLLTGNESRYFDEILCSLHAIALAILAVGPLTAAEQTVDQLIAEVKGSDSTKRLAALDQLSTLGPKAKPAVVVMTAALGHADVETRWRAARALAALGPDAQPAVAALTRLLDDKNERSRAYSAYA